MKALRHLWVDAMRALGRGAKVAASPIAHARRPARAATVLTFRSFGSPRRVCLAGRVTENVGAAEAPYAQDERTRIRKRLRTAWRLLVSREVAQARVRVAFGGDRWETTTDANGFFFTCRPLEGIPDEPMWQPFEAELTAGPDADPQPPVQGHVLVKPSTARRIVISDIDDTVIHTGVANKILMLWRLFATGPHGRSPFPGIGAFYRALHAGSDEIERNPVIYVSRSPWSLYPILEEVFQSHRIPVGPVLMLRDWGVSYRHPFPRRAVDHKRDLVDEILTIDPDAPVVLIGDSGQRDPEIYEEVAHRNPGRVAAIYIRDLEPGSERSRALAEMAVGLAAGGTAMVSASDTVAMAEDAARRGWISRAHLEDVRQAAGAGEA